MSISLADLAPILPTNKKNNMNLSSSTLPSFLSSLSTITPKSAISPCCLLLLPPCSEHLFTNCIYYSFLSPTLLFLLSLFFPLFLSRTLHTPHSHTPVLYQRFPISPHFISFLFLQVHLFHKLRLYYFLPLTKHGVWLALTQTEAFQLFV